MSTNLRPLAALALTALVAAGCASGSSDEGDGGTGTSSTVTVAGGGEQKKKPTTRREKAMRFAACMRDNGVTEFPDPNASGELTIDQIANGSPVDTSSAAFTTALTACKDLQPAGFTGKKRTTTQQEGALKFAQCMRDNGIKDFPDPTPGAPLVDTTRIPSAAGRGALEIPGFTEAMKTCGAQFGSAAGVTRP